MLISVYKALPPVDMMLDDFIEHEEHGTINIKDPISAEVTVFDSNGNNYQAYYHYARQGWVDVEGEGFLDDIVEWEVAGV